MDKKWQKTYATGTITVEPATAKKPTSDAPPQLMSSESQMDLEEMIAIFVSTGFNLNDDVFMPEEVYRALPTVANKPNNIEHEPQEIRGHIYDVAIEPTEADDMSVGKVVSDWKSISKVPKNFNVITKSYLYKGIYPDEVESIMEDARAGKKFVSMETYFDGFDYLVDNHVIARNNETQFLDACLRANGGKGTYANKSVKRVLRNLHFGGQGIVDKPANPKSIIIAKETEPDVETGNVEESLKIIEKHRVYNMSEANLNTKEKEMSVENKDTKAGFPADNGPQILPFKEQFAPVEKPEGVVAKKDFDALKASYDAVVADFEKFKKDQQDKDSKAAEDKKMKDEEDKKKDDENKKKEEAAEKTRLELEDVKKEMSSIKTAARVKQIASDFGKFDISESDMKEIVSEASPMADDVYAKYVSKANRLFKTKSSTSASISGVNTSGAEKTEADKAKEAEKALETAKANAQEVPFSNEDTTESFNAMAKAAVSELFSKKTKETK
jgi:hypothetical protein